MISPGSISFHEIEFHGDGTLSFTSPTGTGMDGVWSQSPDSSYLHMEYYSDSGATLEATFEGRAVNGSFFEGVTTFPSSSWLSAYSVCR